MYALVEYILVGYGTAPAVWEGMVQHLIYGACSQYIRVNTCVTNHRAVLTSAPNLGQDPALVSLHKNSIGITPYLAQLY